MIDVLQSIEFQISLLLFLALVGHFIAIIAALFGLTSWLIGQEIYSAILMMSLLTTVAAPVFILALFESKAYAAKG